MERHTVGQVSYEKEVKIHELTHFGTAPAAKIIEYRDTKFTLEDHIQDLSIYSGAPSPELDQAWHDLLNSELKPALKKKNRKKNENILTGEFRPKRPCRVGIL